MNFKIRVEIDKDADEEIIIKCKSVTDDVLRLEKLICESLDNREMKLHLGEKDYFIVIDEILFFETVGNKTSAHTKDRMYYTDLKLYELEEKLPRSFMRISKSCIINLNLVSALRKELTGICEANFKNADKKVFISRSYYKPFREKINEIRKV